MSGVGSRLRGSIRPAVARESEPRALKGFADSAKELQHTRAPRTTIGTSQQRVQQIASQSQNSKFSALRDLTAGASKR